MLRNAATGALKNISFPSISGAGPSTFAWFVSKAAAETAAPSMRAAFAEAGFAARSYVSPVRGPRAEVLA